MRPASSEVNLLPGDDVRPLLGLNDFVLDVTSTANRADALSLVGIAREISAHHWQSAEAAYRRATIGRNQQP